MTEMRDEQLPEGAKAAQEAAAEAAPGQADIAHDSPDADHGQMQQAATEGSTDTGTGAVTGSGMPD
ncbi:hypothetical protein ACF3NS_10150 [Arsenicicoccus cauae]|uniref:Uncharacterized protein n=2 Tax=Arsenicicoccus TaxID=267408 RepID=A0A6I3IPC6_9MICO|nr:MULTISPECIES: hypothetical protein [Arsenicicoccus]MCG7323712.1 hypothetical protein [Arsenicicoccus bolidensis]MTB71830.1 hypothetical protein [Arsenicicoccus cauae]